MKPELSFLKILLLSTALATTAAQALAADAVFSESADPCTSSEHWTLGSSVPAHFLDDFKAFQKKKNLSVQAFSDGLALRKLAQNQESRLLGEYWISRSLLDSKLVHIAYGGFSAVASRALTSETAGVQTAALGCLVQIHYQNPSLSLPASVASRIGSYFEFNSGSQISAERKTVLWEATGVLLRQLLADEKARDPELDRLLTYLKGSGPYEEFARGLVAAKRARYSETVSHIEKFLNDPSTPSSLKRYHDSAHILAAHALYTLGQNDRASDHLKLVTKSSNELAETLSELSWSYLMAERYSEAIGTGMNLQSGGLKKTFAPEAPMVMAMALNEVCQYPESVKAIQIFRRNYEQPYKWLSGWKASGAQSHLYPQAIDYIRKKSQVPTRVASEWVRSPLFIAAQDEINLLFGEKTSATQLGSSGAKEHARLAKEIMKLAGEVRPKLRIAKMKMKPGQELPREIMDGLVQLKGMITHFKRLQRAAPTWHMILANAKRNAPAIESGLVARIDRDLSRRTDRMFEQLEEISENIQLIEVEIYNGASQDIIWQNAHPDYRQIAKNMKDERAPASEKVWSWGTAAVGSDEETEIWEDELGSFKANTYDNCSSKDRYLALKLSKPGSTRQ